jgi:hypothetical protein
MLSVGGSGGQMSVSSGGAVEACSLGGHVRCVAAELRRGPAALGFAGGFGGLDPSESPPALGTVCAQPGAAFCIGTAVAGLDSSMVGVWVCDQSGSPLDIALAGSAWASSAVSKVSFGWAGGVVGTVRTQTGVVSRVGTAVAGSSSALAGSSVAGSGGVDCG